MKELNKKPGAFILASALASVLTAAAAVLSGRFAVVIIAAAVIGAVALRLHYGALHYAAGEGAIVIRNGLIFRSERTLCTDKILMLHTVKLLGYVLFTVAVTAGGNEVMFCELPPDVRQSVGF